MRYIYGNEEDKIKEWIKNGIEPNDNYWEKKLYLIIDHFINRTTYTPKYRIERVKEIFESYFSGLPVFVVEELISDAVHKAKNKPASQSKDTKADVKSVVIFVEELNAIRELKTYNQQKFAFVLLVNSKYCYQAYRQMRWIEINRKQFMEQAQISIGGDRQKEIIRTLKERELISGEMLPSSKNKKKVKFKIRLEYQLEEGTDAFQVTDFENMILYFRRYIGDEKVGSCQRCGEPVLHNIRKKRFCEKCTLSHNTDNYK